ncbi:restriction endonuclease subunit S, partial [Helicobacter typhlonius]
LSQQCENILHAQNTIKIKDILAKEIRRGINPQYDENGEIAVVKTAQLKNSVIDLECCEFVNKKFFSQKQNAKINKNDIVIASTGKVSIGKIDIWEDEEKEVLADAHISIVTINEKLYNPLFLVYFLRSILGAYQIERDYTGTTNQVELYANEISNFDILNISLEQQQAIAQKIKAQIDNQNFIDEQIKQKQQEISHLIISVLA